MHMPTMFKSDITGAFTNYRDSIEAHSWQVDFVKPKVVFIENALIESHYDMLRERGIAVVCMDPIDEPREGLYDFWALVNAASDDPDFAKQYDTCRWKAAKQKFTELFASKPQSHWCELLEGTDACFAAV
jgi:hypothetical protein